MTEQTQAVLNHHLSAFVENNLDEIMKDFTEESEVWLAEGPLKGLAQITGFFTSIFPLFPSGQTQLNLTQMIVKDEMAYIAWNADSPQAHVPIGSDSFLVKNGKILFQTAVVQIVPKEAPVAEGYK
jgi:hypothetical protein